MGVNSFDGGHDEWLSSEVRKFNANPLCWLKSHDLPKGFTVPPTDELTTMHSEISEHGFDITEECNRPDLARLSGLVSHYIRFSDTMGFLDSPRALASFYEEHDIPNDVFPSSFRYSYCPKCGAFHLFPTFTGSKYAPMIAHSLLANTCRSSAHLLWNLPGSFYLSHITFTILPEDQAGTALDVPTLELKLKQASKLMHTELSKISKTINPDPTKDKPYISAEFNIHVHHSENPCSKPFVHVHFSVLSLVSWRPITKQGRATFNLVNKRYLSKLPKLNLRIQKEVSKPRAERDHEKIKRLYRARRSLITYLERQLRAFFKIDFLKHHKHTRITKDGKSKTSYHLFTRQQLIKSWAGCLDKVGLSSDPDRLVVNENSLKINRYSGARSWSRLMDHLQYVRRPPRLDVHHALKDLEANPELNINLPQDNPEWSEILIRHRTKTSAVGSWRKLKHLTSPETYNPPDDCPICGSQLDTMRFLGGLEIGAPYGILVELRDKTYKFGVVGPPEWVDSAIKGSWRGISD